LAEILHLTDLLGSVKVGGAWVVGDAQLHHGGSELYAVVIREGTSDDAMIAVTGPAASEDKRDR
jgi:hypothetical protein